MGDSIDGVNNHWKPMLKHIDLSKIFLNPSQLFSAVSVQLQNKLQLVNEAQYMWRRVAAAAFSGG